MEPTQKYTVKLRHKNEIYTTQMFGYMLDDIYLKGERSSVISNLKKDEITAVATGVFRDAIEVMYVETLSDLEETMDVQVCIVLICIIYLYVKLLFVKKKNAITDLSLCLSIFYPSQPTATESGK